MDNQRGQGLIEYTLMVLLVTLVFWVAVRNTNIGPQLTKSWDKIVACLDKPMTCKGE